MALMSLLLLDVVMFLLMAGAILVVIGIVLLIAGKLRMRKNPYGKHPSAAWLVCLIIGIAFIVLPLLFLWIINIANVPQ